jgi:hypothetical protein
MLRWIDNDKEIVDIPRKRQFFYKKGRSKIDDSEFSSMKEYANKLIDNEISVNNSKTEFIVPGWLAGAPWTNTPLQILFDKVFIGDDIKCGLWYGLLIYETIIERPELWYCTKTTFQGRDFDQAVYWHNN